MRKYFNLNDSEIQKQRKNACKKKKIYAIINLFLLILTALLWQTNTAHFVTLLFVLGFVLYMNTIQTIRLLDFAKLKNSAIQNDNM